MVDQKVDEMGARLAVQRASSWVCLMAASKAARLVATWAVRSVASMDERRDVRQAEDSAGH